MIDIDPRGKVSLVKFIGAHIAKALQAVEARLLFSCHPRLLGIVQGILEGDLYARQFKTLEPKRARRASLYYPDVETLERRELLDGNALGKAYGQIPLSFEANQGQTDPQVNFLARGSGYVLFLTPTQAVLSLQKDVVRMQLLGANASPNVAVLDRQATTSSYFVGDDPRQWRTNVANYGKVEYLGVYPGVDLVYYGNQQQLEYDFVVGPGANPSVIQLLFQGSQNVTLDLEGNLVMHTAGGDLVEHAPLVYQDATGGRQTVSGRYVRLGQDRVGFQVGAYDTSRQLVIDPVLSFSTLLGFGQVTGTGIAVDASGSAYVTGYASSSDFPITPGAVQAKSAGFQNTFVAKLNATGTALVYATYLGGSSSDGSTGIAVDSSGNAYITGVTHSNNFPTTLGAVQRTYTGTGDAFVAKLNATGTALLYSTYLGGRGVNQANGITVDALGDAYVTGYTNSSDFPTTPGAMQTRLAGFHNGFVAKLNATGTALVYATYLGGSGNDYASAIAVDATGNAYVTGSTYSTDFPTTSGAAQRTYGGGGDAFVAKLSSTGSALLYSTYLGGNSADQANGIAVDASGNAYLTGYTNSPNFPTTLGAVQTRLAGVQNAFVAKLNATGTALVYATYLGGSGNDYGTAIAVDASGDAYVTGSTYSTDFPTTPLVLQRAYGGAGDAFVAKLNATGTALLYSSYLGSSGADQGDSIAVDASANAYVTGLTTSSSFPTTPTAVQLAFGGAYDGFIARISSAAVITLSSSANAPIYGQPITLTATVTSGGNPVANGIVIIQEGNSILAGGKSLNASGQAFFNLSLAAGTHTLTASYTGTVNLPASSVSITQTVLPDSTVTFLKVSATAIPFGQPIMLTAEVVPFTTGPETATGSVVFFDQNTPLATVALSQGTAVLAISALPPGEHSLRAAFLGDVNHTGSPSAVVEVTVGTLNERFVGQLYLDLLKRPVDAGGLATWTALLHQGVSRADVAGAIEQSQEWLADQVQALYHDFLHRDADPTGLNTFVTFLSTGGTLQQVKTLLTGSVEYLQVRGGGTNQGFLTALYQDALNRSPDAGGLAAFTQALNQGASREQVAATIFGSVEYFQDLVANFYQLYLHRAADQGGLNTFVSTLAAGAPDQTVIAALLGSDEYFSHV
jgi:hypothetical protein